MPPRGSDEPARGRKAAAAPPVVAVVLATYAPDADRLDRQIRSVLAQRNVDVRLFVVPDGAEQRARLSLDPNLKGRLAIVPTSQRAGILGNFMRGLEFALARTPGPRTYFAFCDQDDIWFPDKLATQCAALAASPAGLCYCDAEVIDADGARLAASLFAYERRTSHCNLADLLLENDVSGNSILLTRTTAEFVTSAVRGVTHKAGVLHDWWAALAAHARGGTVFLPEPLLSYRRHAGNVMGPRHETPASRLSWPGRICSSQYRNVCADQFRSRVAMSRALLASGLQNPIEGRIALERWNEDIGFLLRSLGGATSNGLRMNETAFAAHVRCIIGWIESRRQIRGRRENSVDRASKPAHVGHAGPGRNER